MSAAHAGSRRKRRWRQLGISLSSRSRPASATIARTGLLRLRTEILFSAMLLSSFFPEGIPFLNIEPNSLARNSIPPIPSLLEENDTENTAIALEKIKIPSASENILLLFGRTQASKAYCPAMLLCFGWSTFWHCWFHLYIVRASLAPWLLGRAQLLFDFSFFDRAQREASLANLVLKFLLSFLVLDQFVKGGKGLFTKAWLNCCKLIRIVPTVVPHGSLACKRACGGGYLSGGKRQAYHAGKTLNQPNHQLTFQPSPSIPRCCWVYNLGLPLTLKPTAPQLVFL